MHVEKQISTCRFTKQNDKMDKKHAPKQVLCYFNIE
jgi:hypothetical protein